MPLPCGLEKCLLVACVSVPVGFNGGLVQGTWVWASENLGLGGMQPVRPESE